VSFLFNETLHTHINNIANDTNTNADDGNADDGDFADTPSEIFGVSLMATPVLDLNGAFGAVDSTVDFVAPPFPHHPIPHPPLFLRL